MKCSECSKLLLFFFFFIRNCVCVCVCVLSLVPLKWVVENFESQPLFIPVSSLGLMTEHFLSHLNHTNMHNEPCSKCEEGWEHHGGKCYYFSVSKSSWTVSRGGCRKFLDQRLKDIMNYPQDKFWFGLTDSAEEGRWLWVDGSLLDKRKEKHFIKHKVGCR
uniref:C-type lectin domain-containing protein n=1 Tax=Haplochromis burtoni TaxID=8153 RepID=A0A3Q2XF64_HAPBU